MRKVLLGIILFGLMSSIAYCQDQPLQLTIKSDKQVYEVGEEIKIIATIKNNSDKEMIVFWSDEMPAGASGGGGTSLIIMPAHLKAYAMYIKPKQAINKIINPGASGPTFVLNYESRGIGLDFKHRSDQEVFTGTLTSNTITIKVVEKKGISKVEALKIAKKVCKEQGWEWREKVVVMERDDNYFVMTNKPQKGGNAEITIDKKTGTVLHKVYHYK